METIKNRTTQEIFEAYGLEVKILNDYAFRITPEESNIFYDWYFTTGALVRHESGKTNFRVNGDFHDPEQLAIFINENILL